MSTSGLAPIEVEQFPSDEVNPKEKGKRAWLLQLAQAIYSRYSQGSTYYSIHNRDKIDLIRRYSDSDQPREIMMDRLLGKGKKNNGNTAAQNVARKGYMNTNFDIVSPAAKLKRIFLGKVGEVDHRVDAESISKASITKKAAKKHRLWVDQQLKSVDEMLKSRGLAAPKNEFEPKTFYELELYESIGGFKLNLEIALEKLIESGFVASDWEDTLKDKLLEDIWDLNFCMAYTSYNSVTGAVESEYVDPKLAVLAYTDEYEGKNTPFVGRIKRMSISQLRSVLAAEGYTEAEIKEIARDRCQNQYGESNGRKGWGYYNRQNPVTRSWGYDDWTVDVLHAEYKSMDLHFNKKRETKDGRTLYHRDKFGDIQNDDTPGRRKETQIVKPHTLYEVNWIIGTGYVYSSGKVKNTVRPTKNEVGFSYDWYRVKGKSTVELMMPHLDSIQLTNVKLQNAKATAAPKGIAIEISSLSDMNLGEGLNKPLDLVRAYKQNGSYFYRSRLLGSKVTNNGLPISEIEGGIGKQLQEWSQMWADDIMKIYEIIGMTPVSAASSTEDDQGLGVTEMQMAATNDALKPFSKALMAIKKRSGTNMALKAMTVMRFSPSVKKAYESIIGKNAVSAITSLEDITLSSLGVSMEALPDRAERQNLLRSANEALKVGKNGDPDIEYQHLFMIEGLVKKGKVKEAQNFLSYVSAKRELERKKEQAANQEKQSNDLRILEQVKSDKQKESFAFETEELNKREAFLTNELAKRNTLDHKQKLEEIRLEKSLDTPASNSTELAMS